MTKRMQGWTARGTAATVLVAAAAGLTLLAAGCSGDNSGNPTGYAPEGQPGTAILLTDVQPFTADTSQVFVTMFVVSPPPPDGFRFYVNPNDEGYRPATESAIPAATTFDSGWSLYQSALDGYDPTTTTVSLIARGTRRGIESSNSLVTQTATILPAPALQLARRARVQQLAPPDSAQISSITPTTFRWAPLPGARSYVLQAFNASTGELGMVVYVDDVSATRIELEMAILNQVPYRWFVVAYDVGGRAIGVSGQRLVQYIRPN